MVTDQQVARAPQHREMAEMHRPVVADLQIVGIGIEPDRDAILRAKRAFVRQELTAVDHHPLTAVADGGDAPVARLGDEAVADLEDRPARRQKDAAGIAVALQLHIIDHHLRQRGEAGKVEDIFEPREGVDLHPSRAVKRLAQRQGSRPGVDGGHIDLAPHARALDQRPHRHVGDIGDRRQHAVVRGAVAGLRGHDIGRPGRAVDNVELAVADRAAGGKGGLVVHRRLHVDRRRHLDPPSVEVKRFMVGEVEKRLERLAEPQFLIPEGGRIGGQVKAARHRQQAVVGHHDRAFEPRRGLQRHIRVQEIGPCRNQKRPSGDVGSGVRRLERRRVVGDAVPHRAVVAYIDHIDQVAQEDRGDILDLDIVDAHHPARRAGQVDTEMPEQGRRAPGHVDAATVAGADDRLDRLDLAIGGQLDRRPGLDHARDMQGARAPGPARDLHRRKVAAHRLHTGADPQVAARQDRRIADVAQLDRSRRFHQFQAAAEILIRRNQHRVGRSVPGRRARRAVPARPLIEPLRKGWRHEDQPVGNCLVHPLNPFAVVCRAAFRRGRGSSAPG